MSDSVVLFSDTIVFELIVRLVLGAIAAFFAIISWTRARSLQWVFVIIGILASYAGTLYRALKLFGFFSGPELLINATPLGILISDNLSMLCFTIACILYIRAHR